MQKKFCVFILSLISVWASAQTTQITIGSAGANESFNDVKFDSLNGGTVEAGTVNNNTGNGNDCFIVKLNASKQVVWQKTITNPGEDVLNRVIVCANGDYVTAGQLYVNGIRRAFVCRLNSATGDILWSATSNNSFVGEIFWDVIETANHNIALVGADAFQNGTNCFLVMLNQSGGLVWSKVSTLGVPDQFTTINQLPNGNLILGGHYDAGGHYNTVIMEVDTATGTIKSQNVYGINTSLPGGVGNVNSILETRCYVKNNQVSFSLFLFNGYGSASNLAICKYDQVTKTLSGNVLYHNGNNSPNTYSYYPVGDNDYIVSQSFSSPVSVFLSRITANTVVFDKKITNSVNAISSIDALGNSVVSSGNYTSGSNSDGYNLFSPLNISAGTTCNMTDPGTMTLLPLTLAPTANSPISFSAASTMTSFNAGAQNTNYTSNTICTSIQAGTGTGLQGVYYNNTVLSGEPLLTRVDPTIDFELTYSKQPLVLSPAPGVVPEDKYSVRWTGQVQPLYSENYTFSVLSDDGVRLWVNGVQLIDNWTNQSATEKNGTIALQAGQKYDIILEYFENTGEAVTKLYWSGTNTAKQIIPQSQLYPVAIAPPAASGNGLQGVYYNGTSLAGEPLLTRVDSVINFELTYSKQPVVLSPAPGLVPEDLYSVRWTGQVQPLFSETYTFYTQSDDGVRLWVNGVQLVDNWTNQGVTEKSGSIVLQAGQKYDIVIEYYENTGEAVTKLLWSSPNTPKAIVPASQLFPANVAPPPPVVPTNGLQGVYYNGIGLSGSALLTRIDTTVDFEFTYSKQPLVLSPAPGIVPEDMYSVRWTGQVQPLLSENYTFYTQSDDGVRLWVNGILLIDNWTNQGVTEKSGSIALQAGQKYDIIIEYYENTGEAVTKLLWSSPGTPKQIVPKSQLYPPTANARTMVTMAAPVKPIIPAAPAMAAAAISPNPVKAGQPARLQISSSKATTATVSISSNNGSRISARTVNLVQGTNNISVNTSGFTQGLYVIIVTGAEKPVSLKLIVE